MQRFLIGCLLCAHLVSARSLLSNHEPHFDSSLQQLNPRPRQLIPTGAKSAVPQQRYPVNVMPTGVVMKRPDHWEIFLDSELVDSRSIRVAVWNVAEDSRRLRIPCDLIPALNSSSQLRLENCIWPSMSETSNNRHELYQVQLEFAAARGSLNKTTTTTTTFPLQIVNRTPSPWPLENDPGVWPPRSPNAVANIMENYQTFGGIDAPYWHQGLDIRSELLMENSLYFQSADSIESDSAIMNSNGRGRFAGRVHSPVDGQVVQRVRYGAGDLYWSVMVMDSDGFVWQFHHMHPSTITVKIGQWIEAGHVLGRIAYWPAVQNGYNYHHLHMNVARPHPSWLNADGQLDLANPPMPYVDGWIYYNPYDFLDHGDTYQQSMKPYSDEIMYFFEHGSNKAFADSSSATRGVQVAGQIDIALSFSSEFTPSNNVPGYPYIHGVHKLNYTIMAIDQPRTIIEQRTLLDMKRMGPDWFPCTPSFTVECGQTFLTSIFKQKFYYKGSTFKSVFNYSQRKVYYMVTNAGRMGFPALELAQGSGWDTTKVPNGRYRIEVTGSDWWGHQTTVSAVIQVNN